MKKTIAALIFAAGLAAGAQAQQVTTVVTGRGDAKVTAEIIASSSTKVVKNAPFSAEAVSESVQVLADGNRITRKVTTKMYRDGDGRFRREDVPAEDGSQNSPFSFVQPISIFDPVAGVRFLLNPTTKTARRLNGGSPGAAVLGVGGTYSISTPAAKVQLETALSAAKAQATLKNNQVVVTTATPVLVPGQAIVSVGGAYSTNSDNKTESLGNKDIEGVNAEGTRTTTVIPAGQIGNERPIEIVYERWYSKDLQMIVYSKHSDPRFGEQTYRLIDINRSEPDRTLFAPPADFKIVTEPPQVWATSPKE